MRAPPPPPAVAFAASVALAPLAAVGGVAAEDAVPCDAVCRPNAGALSDKTNSRSSDTNRVVRPADLA
jgi:hypothetical protein